MTNLIIISGKKQSGKSSLVKAFKDKYYSINTTMLCQDRIVEYSFASPLKHFLKEIFGLSDAQLNGTDEDKNSLTRLQWKNIPFCSDYDKHLLYSNLRPNYKHNPLAYFSEDFLTARELMQIFGSEICRKMHPNCWAEATKNAIIEHWKIRTNEISVISDARFPNELDFFKDMNPIVVRLGRNTYNSSHISETSLDDYNFTQFENCLVLDNQNMSMEEKNRIGTEFLMSKIGS